MVADLVPFKVHFTEAFCTDVLLGQFTTQPVKPFLLVATLAMLGKHLPDNLTDVLEAVMTEVQC